MHSMLVFRKIGFQLAGESKIFQKIRLKNFFPRFTSFRFAMTYYISQVGYSVQIPLKMQEMTEMI